MIPEANITAWRQHAPWQLDSQVEQDLVISRVLVEIFRHQELRAAVAFRGGTALHKLFLSPPARYSEDIDLVQVRPEPAGQLFDWLRQSIAPVLGPEHDRTVSDSSAKMRFDFPAEAPPHPRLRLKIEINTREHFALAGWQTSSFEVTNPWFTGSADLVTFTLEELLATKLRALYQRKKGRDLFDLWFALKRTAAKPELITEMFSKYLSRQEITINRGQFEANLANKLADPDFVSDVDPLLLPGTGYDTGSAARIVLEKLVSLLD